MSSRDLDAGRRWVERRFEEIAREFGAPRPLAREDRWRGDDEPRKRHRRMAYYIELNRHLTRGEVRFSVVDLETAGAGDAPVRAKLGQRIREVLASSAVEWAGRGRLQAEPRRGQAPANRAGAGSETDARRASRSIGRSS